MRIALANGSFSAKLVAAALAAVMVMACASGADAKPRKQKSAQTQSHSKKAKATADRSDENTGPGWKTGTSAIIVDGNTGKVLYEDNADALRHPASVTKVMTLYLLFEQLEAGRLKLDSEMVVSARAAAQSPSKLNVRAGSTIDVEDAIKAIVTRSANDVAVVIAETVGGTEERFADMMTRKAHALGMSRTNFENANGLPNPRQVTTARDLSILGRAIQERFPRQYKYFATRSFTYKGETIGNHNRLLGRIEGVDGIKTGYTRASGFNLLTSVHRDDRYLIGVVLGGSSASSRDARMASLIANNYNRAYAGNRIAPKVTETASNEEEASPAVVAAARPAAPSYPIAPLPAPQRLAYAGADPVVTASIPVRGPAPGSVEPIKPVAVKTVSIQRPAAAPVPAPSFTPGNGTLGFIGSNGSPVAAADIPTQPPAPLQAPQVHAAPIATAATSEPARPIRTASAGPVALPASSFEPASRAAEPASRAAAESTSQPRHSGWGIQIGAFGAEKEARARLDVAQAKAKSLLAQADGFTQKVSKGSTDLYRARFAGLDEKGAKEACRLLQRNDFACMIFRN
ncbi:serine hydrolase [Roseixanthobacter glucoisosaccharinicivorans]|uniref:serine hydrolase n=1 Tax=Roseixanthobacter glucoisosaccharinicivorans TaxID=3119923 RepID=UPI00372723DD